MLVVAGPFHITVNEFGVKKFTDKRVLVQSKLVHIGKRKIDTQPYLIHTVLLFFLIATAFYFSQLLDSIRFDFVAAISTYEL